MGIESAKLAKLIGGEIFGIGAGRDTFFVLVDADVARRFFRARTLDLLAFAFTRMTSSPASLVSYRTDVVGVRHGISEYSF